MKKNKKKTKKPETALEEVPKETLPAAWEWTPEREQCLDLFLKGLPKLQIAERIGVNRNTVTAWCQRKEFLDRANEEQADHIQTTRQRRAMTTNMLADKITKLALTALKTAEDNPSSPKARFAAKDWLSEFRAFRAEERIDTGENVQRHQHAVLGQIQHQHTTALSEQSFKGFLNKAIDSEIVDAEIVEGRDAQEVLVSATRQALLESDLLDDMMDAEVTASMNKTHE